MDLGTVDLVLSSALINLVRARSVPDFLSMVEASVSSFLIFVVAEMDAAKDARRTMMAAILVLLNNFMVVAAMAQWLINSERSRLLE